ncbi:MAG: Xaa-Pro dipeptidase [Methanoregula sp. PtaU1.Bin051]|nr:MAG: Xaa-Pro dipeptidase [Methanoregula sp. PtaU1.Bin051]
MDALDKVIEAAGADVYLMYASSQDPDIRYLTGFTTSDPFVYFKRRNDRGTVIVSHMEAARAARESKAAVMTRTSAGLPEILKRESNLWKATAMMIAGQVGGKILVPPTFPFALARALSETCTIIVDENGLASLRAVKSPKEIRFIRQVQKCTEQAIDTAITMIRRSRVKSGKLSLGNKPLTSERVRSEMHKTLIGLECRTTDTIVACGKTAAIPHAVGNGPLFPDEPIVIDLFPQDEKTGYYSDMTRTVVKGEAVPEIRDMYEAVTEAHDLAVSEIRAGAIGAEIHQSVIEFFSDRGYGNGTKGFVHNLGHGVGIEVHEAPSLGPFGGKLLAGNVITIEPGLYYPKIGGVRIEDIGMVTARGFNRFTNYPRELEL